MLITTAIKKCNGDIIELLFYVSINVNNIRFTHVIVSEIQTQLSLKFQVVFKLSDELADIQYSQITTRKLRKTTLYMKIK